MCMCMFKADPRGFCACLAYPNLRRTCVQSNLRKGICILFLHIRFIEFCSEIKFMLKARNREPSHH